MNSTWLSAPGHEPRSTELTSSYPEAVMWTDYTEIEMPEELQLHVSSLSKHQEVSEEDFNMTSIPVTV